MFVSYNKVTCVRMYNYVQEYWQKEIKLLEQAIEKCDSQYRDAVYNYVSQHYGGAA